MAVKKPTQKDLAQKDQELKPKPAEPVKPARKPTPVKPAARPTPDEEKIRARAHSIWLEEGMPHGRDVEHWARARDELEQG